MTAAQGKSRLVRIKFIHLVRKGLTAKEIAATLGMTVQTVYMRAKGYRMELAAPARKVRDAKHALPFGIRADDLEDMGADDPVEFGEADE